MASEQDGATQTIRAAGGGGGDVERSTARQDAARNRIRDRELPALTGVRGYAACWVVLFHVDQFRNYRLHGVVTATAPIAKAGYLGVDLFFLLSGFVLTYTYINAMRMLRLGSTVSFALGRMFRVLPLTWIILAAVLALSPILHGAWPDSAVGRTVSGFIATLALVYFWLQVPSSWLPPAWSLSAEWLLYLFFPGLIVLVARLRSVTWTVITAALLAALFYALLRRLGSAYTGMDALGKIGLVRCLAEFPLGMLLCRYCQLSSAFNRHGDIALALGMSFLSLAVLGHRYDFLAIFGFLLVIFACSTPGRATTLLLGSRLPTLLGEVSFPLYLLHVIIIDAALRLSRQPLLNHAGAIRLCLAGVLPTSLILAYLLHRGVEQPMQRIGRQVRDRVLARTPGRQTAT